MNILNKILILQSDSGMRNLLFWHKSNLIKTMRIMDINLHNSFLTLWIKSRIILPDKFEQSFLVSTKSNPPRINPSCYCYGAQLFVHLVGHQSPVKTSNYVPRKL